MGIASGSGSRNDYRSTSGSNNTPTAPTSHSTREESLDIRPQVSSTLFSRLSPTLSPGPKFESSQTSPKSQTAFLPFTSLAPILSNRITSSNPFVSQESQIDSFSFTRPNLFNTISSITSPVINTSVVSSVPQPPISAPLIPLVTVEAEPEITIKSIDKGKGKEVLSEEEIEQLFSDQEIDELELEEGGGGEADGDDMSISSRGEDSDDGLIIESLVSPRKEVVAADVIEAEEKLIETKITEVESKGKEIEGAMTEDEEEQEETALVEKINLPDDCRGKAVLAGRKRQSLLITELQRAVTLGRVVLSQT